MTLGSDVSGLTTTAATAAAKGLLSIVVPVYNEAAGLAALHQRHLTISPKTLRQRYRLACEVVYVDDGSADATLVDRPRRCRPTRSTSRWCRCRAISARKPR